MRVKNNSPRREFVAAFYSFHLALNSLQEPSMSFYKAATDTQLIKLQHSDVKHSPNSLGGSSDSSSVTKKWNNSEHRSLQTYTMNLNNSGAAVLNIHPQRLPPRMEC